MDPQLQAEEFLLQRANLSPADCRNALDALRAVEVAPCPEGKVPLTALEYLTVPQPMSHGDPVPSTTVTGLLLDEANQIAGIKGHSRLQSRIVLGGFGAGKTHIRNCMVRMLRQDQSVLISSFTLPPEPAGFSFFYQVFSFPLGHDSKFKEYYMRAYRRLYAIAEKDLDARNPLTASLNGIGDEVLEGRLTRRALHRRLLSLGLTPDLAASFIKFGRDPDEQEGAFRRALSEKFESTQALDTCQKLYDLLNLAGFACLCIFVDDFHNLEQPAWANNRNSLTLNLADWHGELGALFHHTQGMSVYIMTLMHDRFWGVFSLQAGEKLMQHWESKQLKVLEMTRTEVRALICKVLALYQGACAQIPVAVDIDRLSDDIERDIRARPQPQPLPVHPRAVITRLIALMDPQVTWPNPA